jgi:phospholipid transport system substrate-binding protein
MFFHWLPSISAAEPMAEIRSAVDRAMRILNDAELMSKDKKQERVNRLREIVDPLFDFEEMAKLVLGLHWGRRTPAEQRDFVALFRKLLEKIYADRSDSYDGEKIIVSREAVDKDHAQVDSRVINRQGEEFSVVYRLRQTDGKWKVYDVVVEDISIVKNYRSQFHRVITKFSYEELVKRIKEKAG